jgi:hypothetical protein
VHWGSLAQPGPRRRASTPLCQPAVTNPKTVVTAAQRKAAGNETIPPITDRPVWLRVAGLGIWRVSRRTRSYTFFASDGAHHNGNNKYGSVTRTFGTLDNPVGTAPPIDVIIHPNPDAAVNPNYGTYTYLGGGRIYRVPRASQGREVC